MHHTQNMIRLLLIIGIPIAVIILAILVIQNQKLKQTQSATPTGANPKTTGLKNPLIDQAEINRVQKGFSQSATSSAKPTAQPAYHFQYKLVPQLQEKQSSFLHISVANASSCGLGALPDTVTAYALASHISSTGAKKIAADYNLTGEPSSIMMEDGVSFKYYFSNSAASAFVEVIEPSGMMTYHQAIKDDPVKKDVDLTTAETLAETLLKAHMLTDNLNAKGTTFDNASNNYTLSYQKNYGGLKLIDAAQVKFLTDTTPICNITSTNAAGTITIIENSKGSILNVFNNTRQVLEKHDFPREKIDDALTEYADSPIMTPITFGTTKTSGNVTITDAQLVLFDYGNLYGQKMYVPVYVTNGTLTGGGHVITLFPAVSQSALSKAPAFVEKAGSRSMQLGTFNLPPNTTPAPPTAGCFGGLVDYRIQCSANGLPVCSGGISLPSSNDPMGACTNGCQNKTDSFIVKAGQDACKEFMKQQNFEYNGAGDIPVNTDTEVSCSLSACPC